MTLALRAAPPLPRDSRVASRTSLQGRLTTLPRLATLRRLAPAAVLAVTALLVSPRAALACPCRGTFGPGAAVTQVVERWALSLNPAASVVHGTWSPYGDYVPFAETTAQRSVDLALAAGFRPVRSLELGLTAAYGWQSLELSSGSYAAHNLGDTTAHLRWMAREELMPDLGKPFAAPTLEIIAALRLPTGTVRRSGAKSAASGTTGAVGTTATSQGLGTWELSLGAQADKSVSRRVDLALLLQAGYRLPDESIGLARRLGPRALAQLTVRYRLSTETAIGLSNDLGWEGDVRYEGETEPGTGQRVWGAAAFVTFAPIASSWRSGLVLRHTPTVDLLGVNALATTTLALSVGYGGT